MAAAPELSSPAALAAHLASRGELRGVVIEGVDLRGSEIDWEAIDVSGTVFVACAFPDGDTALAVQRNGAIVVPDLSQGRPYRVYPSGPYGYEELIAVDSAIEKWAAARPDPMEPVEAIAQRLHDAAMTDSIYDLIRPPDAPARRVVGIMGGHSVPRDSADYAAVVRLAFGLTRAGYFVATGGGPGVMEAGNLGAYLTRAGDEGAIERALEVLAAAPTAEHPRYRDAAEEVHASLADRDGGESLAIPTWFYGHEPVGRFASHIAKYFANSIREDGLLQIADDGIVFAPGGPGTIQEIFQDAAINAYAPPEQRAPMVFLGREFFAESGVYAVMVGQAAGADPPYGELLKITDDVDEALDFIRSRPRAP